MRNFVVVLVFCSLLIPFLIADDTVQDKQGIEFTPVPMNPDNYFTIIRPVEPVKAASDIPIESIAPDTKMHLTPDWDWSTPLKREKEKQAIGTGNSGPLRVDPDIYEPDNSVTQYQFIILYTNSFSYQSHSLHNSTDQDWFRFYGYAGNKFVFYTLLNLDTVCYIYNDAGTTQLAYNDDDGPGNNFYIEFTPPADGYYKLKIIGYAGQTGYYDLWYTRGTPPDAFEEDDTSSTAGYITPISDTKSDILTLDSSTDEDWRLFFAAAEVTYYFYSQGNTDTRIYCYDQAMTQLIAWDDDGAGFPNFSLTLNVPVSGYYLLRINGYNGATGFYMLNYFAYCEPDGYESNNTHSAATSLGVTPIYSALNLSLHDSYDQDWFRFYAVTGRIYRFSSTGTTDTIAELYQDNGTTLLAQDDDGSGNLNFSLNYEVPVTGYYKLKVYGYAGIMGVYTLQYSYGQDPDIYEPDDTHLTATDLYFDPYDRTQDHTIHTSTDHDWFRFVAIPGRIYTMYSSGTTDTYIEFYADDGVTLLASNDDYNDLNFYLQFTSPTTSFYKFKVRPYYGLDLGSYQLHYLYEANPDIYEPNNTYDQAIVLNPTTTVQTIHNTLHVNTDEDWFRFYANAGHTYTFYSYGNTDVFARLYASDHTTQLAVDDDGAGFPNFMLQYYSQTSGWIYLMVKGYTHSIGAYDLNFNYTAGLATPHYLYIARGGSTIYLDWPDIAGATSYRVEGSNFPNTGFTPLNTTTVSYWNTPASSARRFYRVVAIR
jgi:hypothetical protein